MQQTRPDLGAPASFTFPKPQRVSVGGGTVVAIDVPGQQLASSVSCTPSVVPSSRSTPWASAP